ncbi:type II toxin-antitoxin system PemK/MazF family toxin [Paenibacillus sp. GXUN7292]|uniref:type II toxin-antitoxin system PemK/MazF family toxin n=1 Tax=Paenibacillus sp. GXUN7292 TaxID=3422499 RepID=UPI003D7D4FB8
MTPDYTTLSVIANDERYKQVVSKDNQQIVDNFEPVTNKVINFLEQQSSYDTASVMLEWKQWEQFKGDNSRPWKYKIRDIVLVNLGATNYGYEAAYKHPCIIYGHMFNEVLVVPCSKGRYNKTSEYIIKGERSDGFMHPSGIQLDKVRVISKKRIQGNVLGQVGNTKFNEITNKLIELYFNPVKKRIERLEQTIADLTQSNGELTNKIRLLEEQVASSQGQLTALPIGGNI